jgi:hypothetical protein
MKRKRTIFDYSDMSVPVLIEFLRAVVQAMTDNPNFTTPNPALSELTAAVDDLEKQYLLWSNGDGMAHQPMLDAQKNVLDLLRTLSLYVELTTGDDEAKKKSSGLMLTKDPIPVNKVDFSLKQGTELGDILAKCKVTQKAKSYAFQFYAGENPPADKWLWKLGGISTSAKCKFSTELSSGKVWVRYCSVTKDGMSAWSESIHIVLG